jgi:hypothetical protein
VTGGFLDAGDRRLSPGDVYLAAPLETFDPITAGPGGVSYVEFFSNGQALPEHDKHAAGSGNGTQPDAKGPGE